MIERKIERLGADIRGYNKKEAQEEQHSIKKDIERRQTRQRKVTYRKEKGISKEQM